MLKCERAEALFDTDAATLHFHTSTLFSMYIHPHYPHLSSTRPRDLFSHIYSHICPILLLFTPPFKPTVGHPHFLVKLNPWGHAAHPTPHTSTLKFHTYLTSRLSALFASIHLETSLVFSLQPGAHTSTQPSSPPGGGAGLHWKCSSLDCEREKARSSMCWARAEQLEVWGVDRAA